MLSVLSSNYSYRTQRAALFEFGKVYLPVEGEDLPNEKLILTIGIYGNTDYSEIKGIVEGVFDAIGITYYDIEREEKNPVFHPGQTARLTINKKPLATIGRIHPTVSAKYGINEAVFLATIEFDTLMGVKKLTKKFRPMPKYPVMVRDIAFIVDSDTPVRLIEDVIRRVKNNITEEIKLFDIYQGKPLAENEKSVAYSIKFRAKDRTLTDEEVNAVMGNIVDNAKEKLGATVRK
jgi:phenylalanyl-tRNA synthetase beta chain